METGTIGEKTEINSIETLFQSNSKLNSTRKYIWIILLISLLSHFGASIWDVIFPDIVENVGGTIALWGWASTAFTFTQFIFQFPNAKLSDKYGRRKIIVICMFIYGIGSTLALLGDNVVYLILSRMIQGIGAISAVVLAAIADFTEHKNDKIVVAGRNLTQTLGWILGMFIGGIIGDIFGINAAIIMCIILGFSTSALAYFFLSSNSNNQLKNGQNTPIQKNKNWIKELFQVPEYIYGLIFGSLRYFLYQAIVSYLMWYLKDTWGFSASRRANLLIPVMIFYIIGLFLAGNKSKSKILTLIYGSIGFCVIGIGTILTSLIGPNMSIWFLITSIAFASIGFGLAHTTLTSIMIMKIPAESRGGGTGIAMTVNYGMIILSPLVMTWASEQGGVQFPFLIIGIISLGIMCSAILFSKKLRESDDQKGK